MFVAQSIPTVAYFSMEIALEPSIPTYSGGLGILAGDTIRAAADLGVPMVAVSLVYRRGHFRQSLDAQGNQSELPDSWRPEDVLESVPSPAIVTVVGRTVHLRAWLYRVTGVSGAVVPVYLLDTDLPENDPRDRTLTDTLYGGDLELRLAQETVLGMGGAAFLRDGEHNVAKYHLNEGHSALLVLSLLEERLLREMAADALREIRSLCVFTTHTPVPAGHDRFPADLVRNVIGADRTTVLETIGALGADELNMTDLALRGSYYANGVAMRHAEVSRAMFPGQQLRAITNGVHAATWASPPFAELFDRLLPEWRYDNLYLRYAAGIAKDEIVRAHAMAKATLIAEVERRTRIALDPHALTIGFARRATAYKRADLLFSDIARLADIAQRVGALQVVYAGKAHPRDEPGREVIRRVFEAARALEPTVRVVYLENYDMELAAHLIPGVDVWLNTPERPKEASGTSGMKAALNGVPSLSILDGWWIEGCISGVTGWPIGDPDARSIDPGRDAGSLYERLEEILVLFYQHPERFARIMRSAIAINGGFFNTQRMVAQYVRNAYAPSRASLGEPEMASIG